MKLSIIIPVYNTEKYVDQCIRSCLNQDLSADEYEIVIVNDGTTDNSLAIVENIACNYSNIIIISQDNAGLSAARNTGLTHAKGDYVWFVDSDDWIETNCLKRLMDIVESDNLDGLVHAGLRYVNGSIAKGSEVPFVGKIFSGRDLMSFYRINCAAVKTIYRRNFLEQHNLRFCEGIFHEDHEFTPRAYYFANRLEYVNDFVYYNRLTPGSITQTQNPKKAFDLMVVAQNLYDFKRKHDMNNVDLAFNDLIVAAINQSLYNSLHMDNSSRSRLNEQIKSHNYLLKCYCKSSTRKNRFAGLIFNLFDKHVIEIYLLLSKYYH